VMVADLDGRLNVNAHSSAWHQDGAYSAALLNNAVIDRAGNAVNTALIQARGQGYGPPEISLRPIYQDNGAFTTLLSLRYGPDGVPGTLQTNPATLERWAEVKFFDMPFLYQNAAAFTSPDLRAYSSPPDLQGRFTIATGVDGMPKYELGNAGTRPNELAESPYEMDLTTDSAPGAANARSDQPYTVEELEALLRRFDVDGATLPRRLLDVARVGGGGLPPESLLTTESWDLPVPGFAAPEIATRFNPTAPGGVFNSEFRTASIVDLYVLYRGGAATPNELQAVFAPEVLMGMRMNLNRPLGDGHDTANPAYPIPAQQPGNGVVDEHSWDPTVSESATGNEALQTSFATVPMDLNNNGVLAGAGDATEYQARQIYGTHLYTLVMTLLPRNGATNQVIPMDMDGDDNPTSEETAFIVAQWVANVIDFRDPDSINTAFEFDSDPFNGPSLTLDGFPGTDEAGDRRLVWGMERPELLITETMAWHDRKTTDEGVGGSAAAMTISTRDSSQSARRSSRSSTRGTEAREPRPRFTPTTVRALKASTCGWSVLEARQVLAHGGLPTAQPCWPTAARSELPGFAQHRLDEPASGSGSR
ncbi:MAG: hypothetical protein R3B96_17495, partial [Pirellulaceae bacterium]